MGIKVPNGSGGYTELSIMKRHDGTNWVDCQFARVYENGAWVDKLTRKKILLPTATYWQYYARKEEKATYGTVNFETDRIKMTVSIINTNQSSVQTGVVSKEKLSFSQFTKLKITYFSTTTNTDNYVNQVFCGNIMLANIPTFTSNTLWRDYDWIVANSGIIRNIASNLAISAIPVTLEYDISGIDTENYLYISNRYTYNVQTGTGNLYIYNVELS